MADFNFKDKFEKVEWYIFKSLLLISFIVAAFKILDHEIRLTDFIKQIFEWLRG